MTKPTIRVEVAFGVAPNTSYLYLDDPVRGLLDTGTLAPTSLWSDISEDAREFTTRRGKSRILERVNAGTATISLNDAEGNYNPNNLSGDYVNVETQVKPMRRVRIIATWDSTDYPLFEGFVDGWDNTYQKANPDVPITTVTCTDGFKVLANYQSSEVAEVGEGEDTGTRVQRLLDNAGWPTTDRDIDEGDSTLQATTLAAATLDDIQLAVDSEFGSFWMTADGKARFERRTGRLGNERSYSSRVVFSNESTSGESGEYDADEDYDDESAYDSVTYNLPYAEINFAYDDTLVRNTMFVGNVDGEVQTPSDAESQTEYLPRSFNRTDLILESDTAALHYAEWVLRTFKDAELRVDSITLRPFRTDALWPWVLGLDFHDRITVEYHPAVGDSISLDCFIEGISHSWGANKQWETTFSLSSASGYDGFLILDDPTRGLLDTNLIAF